VLLGEIFIQLSIQYFYYYQCVFFDACVLGVLPAARLLPCSDIPLCIARCRSKRETGGEKVRVEHVGKVEAGSGVEKGSAAVRNTVETDRPPFILHCCATLLNACAAVCD